MKPFLKNKGRKLCISILTGLICLTLAGGCTSNFDDIKGLYKYKETIYNNPASSYFTTKDNADDYLITDDSLTVIHKDGTEEKIAAGFEKSEVDKASFISLFKPEIIMPDISGYKQRYEYSIDKHYRLYTMDSEIWIALCAKNTMWSIFRLVRVED
jgi:hypothetical protein